MWGLSGVFRGGGGAGDGVVVVEDEVCDLRGGQCGQRQRRKSHSRQREKWVVVDVGESFPRCRQLLLMQIRPGRTTETPTQENKDHEVCSIPSLPKLNLVVALSGNR